MQELKESIERASEGYKTNLTEAAIKWANYCLRNLKDDLLTKGLDIARALAQFDVTMRDL